MANTKIHIVATLMAKPGQEEKVRGMLPEKEVRRFRETTLRA
ncbi:hypothetical protein [Archangium sp.]